MTIDDSGNLTLEAVHQWAYSEESTLSIEQVELLHKDCRFIPVLLELMADSQCPKQLSAANHLYDLTNSKLLWRLKGDSALLSEAARTTPFVGLPLVDGWRTHFQWLYERMVTPMKISPEEAELTAKKLCMGMLADRNFGRTGRVFQGYDEFLVSTPTIKRYIYINTLTGMWKHHDGVPWDIEVPPKAQSVHFDLSTRVMRGQLILQCVVSYLWLFSFKLTIPTPLMAVLIAMCIGFPIVIARVSSEYKIQKRIVFIFTSFLISCITLNVLLLITQ